MKCSHKTLTFLAGFVWLCIGITLLSLGIHFILETVSNPMLTHVSGRFSISKLVSKFSSDPTQIAVILITLSLIVGYFKGKMVLAKSVKRQLTRIKTLPDPSSLKYLYSKGYYILIASMMFLGMVMRFLPITVDTRGFVDIAIGAALINGAMLYFRSLSYYASQSKRGS